MVRSGLALLRRMGLDYSCFKIYSIPLAGTPTGKTAGMPSGYRVAEVRAEDLERSPCLELRDCRDYLGDEAYVFGVYRGDGILACVQCIWFGERYRRASFWPLKANEAASMHLVSAPSEQGNGLATCLKQESAKRLHQRGFSRLYSRIWWTNRASLRVSEKAGWTHVGTVVEVILPGRYKPLRLVRRKKNIPGFADTITAASSRTAR